ncbi:hypothetical protein ACH4S8_30830 [Streptomyces sp. NPDC021080]|uniref:hypothetical protein n=1 Tax=Streptomyces sp. NPDC021080 TaxID=3365110 RepID=UPI0037A5FD4B
MRERIERDLDGHDRDGFLVLLPDGTPIGRIALTDQGLADGTAEIMLMPGRTTGAGTMARTPWTRWSTSPSVNCPCTASRPSPTPPTPRLSPSCLDGGRDGSRGEWWVEAADRRL